jgi:hypothetical protein
MIYFKFVHYFRNNFHGFKFVHYFLEILFIFWNFVHLENIVLILSLELQIIKILQLKKIEKMFRF